jgi:hypothetical protein
MGAAEVNKPQTATLKTSLAGAAFISSRGEVYRLFPNVDDLDLGNDFSLDEFNSFEFDQDKTHDQFEVERDQIDNETESHAVSDSEFQNEVGSEFVADTDCEVLGQRFRVVGRGYGDAIAELLALEVPKPIINVPANIPPQEVSLEEKFRRIRAVTGVCGKFQPTTQDKIIGNTNPVAKNQSAKPLTQTPIAADHANLDKSNEATLKFPKQLEYKGQNIPEPVRASKIELLFNPFRNNTAIEIDEIIHGNLVPIVDAVPDFFVQKPLGTI